MKLRFNGLETKTVSLVQRFHIHRALNSPRGMEMALGGSIILGSRTVLYRVEDFRV